MFDASKAKSTGYTSLDDINVSDKVTIEYDVKLGRNIAVVITREQ